MSPSKVVQRKIAKGVSGLESYLPFTKVKFFTSNVRTPFPCDVAFDDFCRISYSHAVVTYLFGKYATNA